MIATITIEFKRLQMGLSNLLFQGLLDNTSNISLNAIEHESIKKSCSNLIWLPGNMYGNNNGIL